MKRIVPLAILVIVLAACERSDPEPLPTRIESVDALATSVAQTENAPPEGFRGPLAFAQIDANLTSLSNWRYAMIFAFDGVFAGTPRPATARTEAQVWFNQLDTSRRVQLTASGVLIADDAETLIEREGVRLGQDTFLVVDHICQVDASPEAAALIADLRAGDLIGGVNRGVPNGENAVINGEQVWRYEFGPDDLNLPGVVFGESGRILEFRGEMWVAPEHDAVIRYYLTLEVENVLITVLAENPDNAVPVTGQLIIRYDLYDIGVDPNINQPFGC